MQSYYLNHQDIIINKKLTDKEFRIYSYICSEYWIKKNVAWIDICKISEVFSYNTKEVILILDKLATIIVNGKQLLEIYKDKQGTKFKMPYYKYLLETIGLTTNKYKTAFKNIKDQAQTILSKENKKYLYQNLDQFNLSEILKDMPDEDFEK